MIASPMYFSTVPPCFSSTARIVLKYSFRSERSVSVSRRSASGVEPLRSEKTTVTIFRTSSGTTCVSPSGEPHIPQMRNRSGFSSPQLGQICTGRVYARPLRGRAYVLAGRGLDQVRRGGSPPWRYPVVMLPLLPSLFWLTMHGADSSGDLLGHRGAKP